VVAQIWVSLSRWPREAGLAGLRFKQMSHLGLDPIELLYAISEHAVEGHHAAALNAEKSRSRIARMHEVFRDEQKRSEQYTGGGAKVDVVIGTHHYRMDRLAMRRTGMTKISDAVTRSLAMLKREEDDSGA
jgi:hypothetical protein